MGCESDVPTISCLPPEILSEVFLFGHAIVASEADSDAALLARFVPFELAISHVSCFWRAVAHATHAVWRRIHITTYSKPDRVLAYVQRSRGCSLDVRIWAPYILGRDLDARAIDAVFARLCDWQRCTIVLAMEKHNKPIITRLCGAVAPRLTYLSITLHESQSLFTGRTILDDSCCQLSFLRLRGIGIRSFSPPLKRLTTLHLDQTNYTIMQYPSFRQILTNTPHLENLSLHGDMIGPRNWPTGWDDSTVIKLPALRALRVCGSSGYVYSGILMNVEAPELHSLTLKGAFPRDLDPFFETSMSKFHSVRSLTFCDVDITIADTFKCLGRAFPLLREFTCFNPAYQTPYILKVMGDPDIPPFWPYLHTMTFILNFEQQTLFKRAIRHRIAVGRPLYKLRLMPCALDGILIMPDLEWLRHRVVLESVNVFPECWPHGREFEDEDDDFLLR